MGRAGGGYALRPVAAAVSELSLSRSEAVALAMGTHGTAAGHFYVLQTLMCLVSV